MLNLKTIFKTISSRKEKDEDDSVSWHSPWDFQLFAKSEKTYWFVEAYWTIWRFFHHGLGNPSIAYDLIRAFIQRGRRGWADQDVWSLDGYLNSWLPDALRRLRDTKQGVPPRNV